MDLTLPLFAVRTPMGGTESSIYNFTRALVSAGADLKIAMSRDEYLSPEFIAWLKRAPLSVVRYPSWGAHHQFRFIEESWFALLDRSSHVLYPNYFIPPFRPRQAFSGAIILDIQCKTFPEYFGKRRLQWLQMQHQRMIKLADRIMFISEFERQQMFKYYGTAYADRTDVIHVPIDWSRYDGEASPKVRELAKKRFIFAVAHPYPHKNMDTLIAAFGIVASKDKDLALVLSGKPAPTIQAAADKLQPDARSRVHFTGFVSDADLGALYRSANVFATPSRYEGFGMPAIEALGFERPVLVSDAGSLREVTLDRANYLPPYATPEEWAEALGALIDKPGDAALARKVRDLYAPKAIGDRIVASMMR